MEAKEQRYMDNARNEQQKSIDRELHREQIREVRPFFVLVVLVLGGMYGVIVWATPAFQRLAILIPATLLMILHLALHWTLPGQIWIHPTVEHGVRNTLLYLVLQLAIIVGITSFVPGEGVFFGLYLALIGETIGMFNTLRRAALPVVGILVVGFINASWVLAGDQLPDWALMLIPMLLFTAIYVILFNRQVQARQEARELVDELQKVNAQLAQYADQVATLTLQNERQRMARELHDTLAQGLVGVILQLETVDVQLAKDRSEEAQALVRTTMERARMTLAEARQAISDLRMETTDLREAIEGAVERFEQATGIVCEVVLDDLSGISPELVDHLMRACSEGLSNITRHAHASRVRLELLRGEDGLTLRLSDDGVGFSMAQVEGKSGHYGLIGLRERARLAGGRFEVTSEPGGQGTMLTFSLPLDREDPHV